MLVFLMFTSLYKENMNRSVFVFYPCSSENYVILRACWIPALRMWVICKQLRSPPKIYCITPFPVGIKEVVRSRERMSGRDTGGHQIISFH